MWVDWGWVGYIMGGGVEEGGELGWVWVGGLVCLVDGVYGWGGGFYFLEGVVVDVYGFFCYVWGCDGDEDV